MHADETVGATLGRFVAQSAWPDIGPALRHEARRSLLNFVGGALGVARTPPVASIAEVLQALTGSPRTTVIAAPSGWGCWMPPSSMRSAPICSTTTTRI
jgi:2-methylcitrate dehydratase PrpD